MTARPALEVSAAGTFRIDLPSDLGTVESISSGRGPTLVHIQEAHGDYETQKKIEAILHFLKNHYDIRLLLLEGNAFQLHPELFRYFPEQKNLNRAIGEDLAKKGLASGPALFLQQQEQAEGWGIEKLESYRENGRDFYEVLTRREKTGTFLNQMDLQIGRLTSPYLGADLRHFLKRVDDFEEGLVPFHGWLEQLKDCAKKYLAQDLASPAFQLEWPMLVRIFVLKDFESRMDSAQFAAEHKKFSLAIRGLPEDVRSQVEALLSAPLNQNRLSDPETSRLFEALVSALPADFPYRNYPQVTLFIGHLILQSELKADRLSREMSELTRKISGRLAVSDKEKSIVKLLENHRLLKRLFKLELTPDDYSAVSSPPLYGDRDGSVRSPVGAASSPRKRGSIPSESVDSRQNIAGMTEGKGAGMTEGKGEEMTRREEASFRPSALIQQFTQLNSDKRVRDLEFSHLAEIDALYDKALDFYRGARQRDHDMIENVEKRLVESGQKKAVVVTGGFHSEPFKNYFEQKGYNYALISPRMERVGTARENYVQSVLQNYIAPLDSGRATYRDVDYPLNSASEILQSGRNPKRVIAAIVAAIRETSRSRGVSPGDIDAAAADYRWQVSGGAKSLAIPKLQPVKTAATKPPATADFFKRRSEMRIDEGRPAKSEWTLAGLQQAAQSFWDRYPVQIIFSFLGLIAFVGISSYLYSAREHAAEWQESKSAANIQQVRDARSQNDADRLDKLGNEARARHDRIAKLIAEAEAAKSDHVNNTTQDRLNLAHRYATFDLFVADKADLNENEVSANPATRVGGQTANYWKTNLDQLEQQAIQTRFEGELALDLMDLAEELAQEDAAAKAMDGHVADFEKITPFLLAAPMKKEAKELRGELEEFQKGELSFEHNLFTQKTSAMRERVDQKLYKENAAYKTHRDHRDTLENLFNQKIKPAADTARSIKKSLEDMSSNLTAAAVNHGLAAENSDVVVKYEESYTDSRGRERTRTRTRHEDHSGPYRLLAAGFEAAANGNASDVKTGMKTLEAQLSALNTDSAFHAEGLSLPKRTGSQVPEQGALGFLGTFFGSSIWNLFSSLSSIAHVNKALGHFEPVAEMMEENEALVRQRADSERKKVETAIDRYLGIQKQKAQKAEKEARSEMRIDEGRRDVLKVGVAGALTWLAAALGLEAAEKSPARVLTEEDRKRKKAEDIYKWARGNPNQKPDVRIDITVGSDGAEAFTLEDGYDDKLQKLSQAQIDSHFRWRHLVMGLAADIAKTFKNKKDQDGKWTLTPLTQAQIADLAWHLQSVKAEDILSSSLTTTPVFTKEDLNKLKLFKDPATFLHTYARAQVKMVMGVGDRKFYEGILSREVLASDFMQYVPPGKKEAVDAVKNEILQNPAAQAKLDALMAETREETLLQLARVIFEMDVTNPAVADFEPGDANFLANQAWPGKPKTIRGFIEFLAHRKAAQRTVELAAERLMNLIYQAMPNAEQNKLEKAQADKRTKQDKLQGVIDALMQEYIEKPKGTADGVKPTEAQQKKREAINGVLSGALEEIKRLDEKYRSLRFYGGEEAFRDVVKFSAEYAQKAAEQQANITRVLVENNPKILDAQYGTVSIEDRFEAVVTAIGEQPYHLELLMAHPARMELLKKDVEAKGVILKALLSKHPGFLDMQYILSPKVREARKPTGFLANANEQVTNELKEALIDLVTIHRARILPMLKTLSAAARRSEVRETGRAPLSDFVLSRQAKSEMRNDSEAGNQRLILTSADRFGMNLLDYFFDFWKQDLIRRGDDPAAVQDDVEQQKQALRHNFYGYHRDPRRLVEGFEPFLSDDEIQSLARILAAAGLDFLFTDGVAYTTVYHPDMPDRYSPLMVLSVPIQDEATGRLHIRPEILIADIPTQGQGREKYLKTTNSVAYPEISDIEQVLKAVINNAEAPPRNQDSARMILQSMRASAELSQSRHNPVPSEESAKKSARTILFHEIGEAIWGILPASLQQEWDNLLDTELVAGLVYFHAKRLYLSHQAEGSPVAVPDIVEFFADYFSMAFYPENIFKEYGDEMPPRIGQFMQRVRDYLQDKHRQGRNIWELEPGVEPAGTVIIEPNEISERLARRSEMRIDEGRRDVLKVGVAGALTWLAAALGLEAAEKSPARVLTEEDRKRKKAEDIYKWARGNPNQKPEVRIDITVGSDGAEAFILEDGYDDKLQKLSQTQIDSHFRWRHLVMALAADIAKTFKNKKDQDGKWTLTPLTQAQIEDLAWHLQSVKPEDILSSSLTTTPVFTKEDLNKLKLFKDPATFLHTYARAQVKMVMGVGDRKFYEGILSREVLASDFMQYVPPGKKEAVDAVKNEILQNPAAQAKLDALMAETREETLLQLARVIFEMDVTNPAVADFEPGDANFLANQAWPGKPKTIRGFIEFLAHRKAAQRTVELAAERLMSLIYQAMPNAEQNKLEKAQADKRTKQDKLQGVIDALMQEYIEKPKGTADGIKPTEAQQKKREAINGALSGALEEIKRLDEKYRSLRFFGGEEAFRDVVKFSAEYAQKAAEQQANITRVLVENNPKILDAQYGTVPIEDRFEAVVTAIGEQPYHLELLMAHPARMELLKKDVEAKGVILKALLNKHPGFLDMQYILSPKVREARKPTGFLANANEQVTNELKEALIDLVTANRAKILPMLKTLSAAARRSEMRQSDETTLEPAAVLAALRSEWTNVRRKTLGYIYSNIAATGLAPFVIPPIGDLIRKNQMWEAATLAAISAALAFGWLFYATGRIKFYMDRQEVLDSSMEELQGAPTAERRSEMRPALLGAVLALTMAVVSPLRADHKIVPGGPTVREQVGEKVDEAVAKLKGMAIDPYSEPGGQEGEMVRPNPAIQAKFHYVGNITSYYRPEHYESLEAFVEAVSEDVLGMAAYGDANRTQFVLVLPQGGYLIALDENEKVPATREEIQLTFYSSDKLWIEGRGKGPVKITEKEVERILQQGRERYAAGYNPLKLFLYGLKWSPVVTWILALLTAGGTAWVYRSIRKSAKSATQLEAKSEMRTPEEQPEQFQFKSGTAVDKYLKDHWTRIFVPIADLAAQGFTLRVDRFGTSLISDQELAQIPADELRDLTRPKNYQEYDLTLDERGVLRVVYHDLSGVEKPVLRFLFPEPELDEPREAWADYLTVYEGQTTVSADEETARDEIELRLHILEQYEQPGEGGDAMRLAHTAADIARIREDVRRMQGVFFIHRDKVDGVEGFTLRRLDTRVEVVMEVKEKVLRPKRPAAVQPVIETVPPVVLPEKVPLLSGPASRVLDAISGFTLHESDLENAHEFKIVTSLGKPFPNGSAELEEQGYRSWQEAAEDLQPREYVFKMGAAGTRDENTLIIQQTPWNAEGGQPVEQWKFSKAAFDAGEDHLTVFDLATMEKNAEEVYALEELLDPANEEALELAASADGRSLRAFRNAKTRELAEKRGDLFDIIPAQDADGKMLWDIKPVHRKKAQQQHMEIRFTAKAADGRETRKPLTKEELESYQLALAGLSDVQLYALYLRETRTEGAAAVAEVDAAITQHVPQTASLEDLRTAIIVEHAVRTLDQEGQYAPKTSERQLPELTALSLTGYPSRFFESWVMFGRLNTILEQEKNRSRPNVVRFIFDVLESAGAWNPARTAQIPKGRFYNQPDGALLWLKHQPEGTQFLAAHLGLPNLHLGTLDLSEEQRNLLPENVELVLSGEKAGIYSVTVKPAAEVPASEQPPRSLGAARETLNRLRAMMGQGFKVETRGAELTPVQVKAMRKLLRREIEIAMFVKGSPAGVTPGTAPSTQFPALKELKSFLNALKNLYDKDGNRQAKSEMRRDAAMKDVAVLTRQYFTNGVMSLTMEASEVQMAIRSIQAAEAPVEISLPPQIQRAVNVLIVNQGIANTTRPVIDHRHLATKVESSALEDIMATLAILIGKPGLKYYMPVTGTESAYSDFYSRLDSALQAKFQVTLAQIPNFKLERVSFAENLKRSINQYLNGLGKVDSAAVLSGDERLVRESGFATLRQPLRIRIDQENYRPAAILAAAEDLSQKALDALDRFEAASSFVQTRLAGLMADLAALKAVIRAA